MKKIFKYSILGLFLTGTLSSCEKYLDINDNPNAATEATPNVVLPQAIVATSQAKAATNTAFHADQSGAWANAGGFGGFGAVLSYGFTSNDFGGAWTNFYSNLKDYKYVLDNTTPEGATAFSNAIARIMTAYDYQHLVDMYGDIPYTEALKGRDNLTPAYDKAEDVYKSLVSELNKAISDISNAQAANASVPNSTNVVPEIVDPLFKGDMNKWKRFANTIKLRLLIRAQESSLTGFVDGEFASFDASLGIITEDASVNPGFAKEAGRQNPAYNTFGFTISNAQVNNSRIATIWMLSFYDGTKLEDPDRGSVIYRSFPSTAANQLGDESSDVPTAPSGSSAFFTGSAAGGNGQGVLKGPAAAYPIFTHSEALFLLAEARLNGKVAGNAKDAFEAGIKASFNYLYKDATGALPSGYDPAVDASEYIAAHSTSTDPEKSVYYLANWELTDNILDDDYNKDVTERRLEAIITQKYIALNMIHNEERYNEFRRTTYPYVVNGSSNPVETFASLRSASTRPDKLVARALYPTTEYSLNASNVPGGITLFGSRIFWDPN